MAEAKFPPESKMPYSARQLELTACLFFHVRKAASETYKNPDGTTLLTYADTLLDRDNVRKRVLDYELANGWLIDDRSTLTQSLAQPAAQPMAPQQAPAPVVPSIGFMPVQPPQAVQPMQPVQMMVPTMPMEAPTQQPPPSAVDEGGGMVMPTSKIRRSNVLGGPTAIPPAPPMATVLQAPPSPPTPIPVPQAQVMPQAPIMQAPTPNIPQVPVVNVPQMAGGIDLSGVLAKLDEISKSTNGDFKQLVTNLSAQANETNKLLREINDGVKSLRELQSVSFVALHHLYLVSPMGQQTGEAGKNLATFKDYLSQYVPR